MTEWLSVHLRFDGSLYGAEGDSLIRNGVGTFIRSASGSGLLRRFFFIRYTDDVPHIRLRLLARTDQARRQLRAAARSAAFRPAGATRGIRWVTYVPEFDRYGGRDAIPVAERHFHASSGFVLDLLGTEVTVDRSRRLGVAALAMLVQLRAFHDSKVAAHAASTDYRTRYLGAQRAKGGYADQVGRSIDQNVKSQVTAVRQKFAGVWDLLGDPQALPAPVRRFSRSLQRERARLTQLARRGGVVVNGTSCPDWERASAALLPSFMHMTNNRLGVSIPEEVLLASAIAEVLDEG